VQRGVIGGEYGLPRSALEDLHTAAVGEAHDPHAIVQAENRALTGLHYNRDVSELLAHPPEGLQLDEAGCRTRARSASRRARRAEASDARFERTRAFSGRPSKRFGRRATRCTSRYHGGVAHG